MPTIFICYRRDDNAYPPHIIYTGLKKRYGADSVVLDVDAIPPGTDFREYLYEKIISCDIVIAVIGEKWIDILNQRLSDPEDFVRIEIQIALKNKIPVVPVLVDSASMPDEKHLPPELAKLASIQAAEVRGSRDLQAQLDRLINNLDSLYVSLLAERNAEKEQKRKAEPKGTHRFLFVSPRRAAEIERARQIAEHGLEIGRKIISGFLPAELPVPAGWEIAAHFQPAHQICGDFYDVFELAGGRCLGIVIADVCGHGVDESFWMALTRTLIRVFALQGTDRLGVKPADPAGWSQTLVLETVGQTNAYIMNNHGDAGMFATLFVGILDPATGRLTYINSGHEDGLFLRNGSPAAYLKNTGFPLGTLSNAAYNTESIVFEAGDSLFLYTDGVTDACNGAGMPFSIQRLVGAVSVKIASAQTLLDNVIEALNRHVGKYSPADNVTLLAIRKIHTPTNI